MSEGRSCHLPIVEGMLCDDRRHARREAEPAHEMRESKVTDLRLEANALDCADTVLEFAFKARPSQVVGHFFAANYATRWPAVGVPTGLDIREPTLPSRKALASSTRMRSSCSDLQVGSSPAAIKSYVFDLPMRPSTKIVDGESVSLIHFG